MRKTKQVSGERILLLISRQGQVLQLFCGKIVADWGIDHYTNVNVDECAIRFLFL
ncbi:hypothetical protein LZG74_18820 [Dyadobacter sp. CY327]|uniref:hypothetical protein n=1 Tax=Dyadobacter sp. CY327 TaxID=2907301 RepID=UPI001F22472B|nr:hypothetical protein [Dyadobacter sp. CY327]MCE7072378.1 hypothetical protein [Dyadobacter sp. CY327]